MAVASSVRVFRHRITIAENSHLRESGLDGFSDCGKLITFGYWDSGFRRFAAGATGGEAPVADEGDRLSARGRRGNMVAADVGRWRGVASAPRGE